jgi:hypothetical protein
LVALIDASEGFIAEVLEVIQQTLANRFGADVMNVILYNFQNSTKLTKEDIVRKPQQFEGFLDSMFGHGSRIMRKLLIKSLEDHFKLPDGGRTLDLESTIEKAWKTKQTLSA